MPSRHFAQIVFADSPSPSAGGRVLPFGLVEVEVGGVATRAVIDTGANISVIDSRFAGRVGLRVVDNDVSAVDPTGQAAVTRWAPDARLVVPGIDEAVMEAVVVDLPQVLLESGVAVILSPQQLAKRRVVEIDYPSRRLRVLAPGTEQPMGGRVCVVQGQGIEARTLAAEATVQGVPAVLELDTGAGFSSLVRSAAPAQALEAHDPVETTEGVGIAGAMQRKNYDDVQLSALGHFWSTRVTVTPGLRREECGVEGRLGFPEAKNCIVRIGATSFSLSCPARQ